MGWSVRLFVLLCLSGLSVIAESPKGNDDGLLCLSFLFSCRCLFQPFPEGMCIEGVYPIGQGDDDVPMVDVHGTAARHADILAYLIVHQHACLADAPYLPAYGGGREVEQVGYLHKGHPHLFLRVAFHAYASVLVYSDDSSHGVPC